MREYPIFFPQQKIATSKKTQEWYKKCLDAAEVLSLYRYDGTSEKHRKMQVWEDLYNDIIDENEIERVFNPMQLSEASFPASIKNYPLSVPKIDLLKGEEIKRKFDWSVVSRNEEAHSEYSKRIRDEILNFMAQEILSDNYDETTAAQKLQDISKYYQYDYKNMEEIAATRVLQYLWREQVLRQTFSEGFHDALVKSAEVYRVDNIGGEPSLLRVDPRNVFAIRRGNSNKYEDADIIVELGYEPIGKIIDEFHDELTSADVLALETGQVQKSDGSGILGYKNTFPRLYSSTQLGGDSDFAEELFSMNSAYNLPFDSEGNVRVIRARWRGRRKIGRLTYFNPVSGDKEDRLVSENYKVKDIEGEVVKWIWVNEAYEATKIANNIYVRLQPREVQIRHFDNPSKCFLGYVGTDYELSLMARMEPYQYLYNVYMRRLELAIAKYKGPIYELDISKIPDEWDIDQWMYYGEALGWAVIDSFNEGKKGAATGKIAGNFNTTGKVMDANAGNYIQQLVIMLQYIEKQMGQIAGVTEQREGQIDNRETVGGIERAVTQSSHITEKWFFIHDETKKRAMLALLDVAKVVWKNKSKKLNYIMEDMSRVVIQLGEDFSSSEYDIFTSNSSQDMEIRSAIKELAHAAVQNGASLALPVRVLRSDSITEMAKILDADEKSRLEREDQIRQEEISSKERIAQQTLQAKEAELEFRYYEVDSNNATKLEIANKGDNSFPEVKDNSLDKEKLNLQREKQTSDSSIKRSQLDETIRHNKAAESISRIQKSKPVSKN